MYKHTPFSRWILLGIVLCFSISCFGQAYYISQQVVGMNASNIPIDDWNLTSTTGETVIAHLHQPDANIQITQGFHQPTFQFTTAILDTKDPLSLEAYPNPVQQTLTLEFTELKTTDRYQVEVINVLGQPEIRMLPSSDRKKMVDCQALLDGYYFLKVTTVNNDRQTVIPFIKN